MYAAMYVYIMFHMNSICLASVRRPMSRDENVPFSAVDVHYDVIYFGCFSSNSLCQAGRCDLDCQTKHFFGNF